MMASFYCTCPSRLISGPVRISPATSFFSRLQALEFLSLTGTGGASFLNGEPLLCNGANLAFERELFLEAYPFLYPQVPTGDDMFLMLYTLRHYPGSLRYLKSPDAIVDTRPVPTPAAFFSQRMRWASKAGLYRNSRLILLSLLVFLFNAWLITLAALSFTGGSCAWIFAAFFFLKSLVDYVFLKAFCGFNRQENLMKVFIPSQLIHPFYILAAAAGGWILSGRYRQNGK